MTFDEMLEKVLEILPRAEIGEDNFGQMVIYTDMKCVRVNAEDAIEQVVPMEWEEEL